MDLVPNSQPIIILAFEQERVWEERVERSSTMYLIDRLRRQLHAHGCRQKLYVLNRLHANDREDVGGLAEQIREGLSNSDQLCIGGLLSCSTHDVLRCCVLRTR